MQYKTYQEAKIANPDSEIYYSGPRRLGDKGFFSTRESATGLNHECRPKDYCVTLKSFLASGKRLVLGDAYIGASGIVTIVGDSTTEGAVNEHCSSDGSRYILKAKALENPAHEWVNGDECIHSHHSYKSNPNMIYVGKFPKVAGKHVCISELSGLVIVDDNYLSKPETPEQKLERQRLESAYHLACIAGDFGRWGDEFTFEHFKLDENAVKYWLAIVDETNYLLYE